MNGTRVTDLQRAGTFRVETTDAVRQADAVVLAVPAYAAGGILKGVHTRLASLCSDIPYASTATVAGAGSQGRRPRSVEWVQACRSA